MQHATWQTTRCVGVRGIPSLIILDDEGRLVDSDGRSSFEEYFERATHLARERDLLARERSLRGLSVEQQLARAMGLLKMVDEAVLEQRKTLATLSTLLDNVIRHARARMKCEPSERAEEASGGRAERESGASESEGSKRWRARGASERVRECFAASRPTPSSSASKAQTSACKSRSSA
jgi:hypothetical protein